MKSAYRYIGPLVLAVTITSGAGLVLADLRPAVAREEAGAVLVPAPLLDEPVAAGRRTESAVFAGGCFWGVQAVFQHLRGVERAVSGYAGGSAADADYDTVSTGRTGHAEAVEVSFDPAQVSYGTLLRVYFSVAHDPTQVDRQGPDRGPQYRSEIFTTSAEQKRVAENYIRQIDQAGVFGRPLATRVEPLSAFFPAEKYHQDYATIHPDSGYIATFDLPKLGKLEQLFPQLYRATPVLVAATADPVGR